MNFSTVEGRLSRCNFHLTSAGGCAILRSKQKFVERQEGGTLDVAAAVLGIRLLTDGLHQPLAAVVGHGGYPQVVSLALSLLITSLYGLHPLPPLHPSSYLGLLTDTVLNAVVVWGATMGTNDLLKVWQKGAS